MLERAGYEEPSRTLWLWFEGGEKYAYQNVPADVFNALCHAESAGTFFNDYIKDRYDFTRDPARRRFGP
ncbi:KTSC domain-containing protein [Sphingobium sp. SCG-1]|uniref:KTSC domain-containing protein n=1 Tax=Sphingobium sp. SCG-1 TaxID=2072936 RepID=UPI001670DE3B|nr:KTSC domain-containing protein [Sphingobium sp. SCG-1]